MTDRTKFEAMLEALINEDHEAAKDIFHNIVVGKSREIYEKLLAEEFEEEEESEEDDTDSFGDDEDEGDDDFGGDTFGDDEEGEDDEFGDKEGDEFGDEEGDEFGDDEFGDEEDGDLENRVLDLEDALDELKSEFEQLLAGEEDEPEHDDMFGGDEMGMGDDDMGMGGDEFGAGEEENEFQSMFEYVNKVALPKHGDNGVNNKSIFNKAKYNDMGGVAPKFAGESKGEGTQGGLLSPKAGDLTSGLGTIQNRPDSKAGKTAFKKREPGHGPETKGKSPDNGQNTTSVFRGRGSK
jgi:hypothetical protein